jgi:ABC-type multidrug transport system fused ATPase/permease subunit
MSTVRSCDIIFELENGKISGIGTYDGLLKSSALFRRMTGDQLGATLRDRSGRVT